MSNIEFLDKKDEIRKEFVIKALIDLIHETQEEEHYLQSEEFAEFFTKVELIKDMLLE